ncbi:MAG: helix-turn-helix domain-containing protein [Geminicoccaceae bacterium]
MLHRVPAEVFAPGEFIREELDARGWTQGDLAEILGRPLRLVNELIAGKKQITPETAKGLADAFDGTDPIYWMSLDSAYRLSKAKPVDEAVSRRARLYSRFPVREMIKRGWIEASESLDVLEFRVRSFFRINSLDETPIFSHAAKAAQYDERTSLQWAWLWRAKQLAQSIGAAPYSERKLRDAVTRLRALLAAPEEIRHVPRTLADAGVRLVLVEFLPGAKIDGATFWSDCSSPVIAMSLRFDRINNFWFVLRHEIEHVLNGDGQQVPIIDIELSERLASGTADVLEEEKRANGAAAEFIAPTKELDDFIARVRPLYSEQRIMLFARRIGVHPGLVVGQLQHRKEIPYSNLQRHLVKVRHIIISSGLTDGWGHTPTATEEGA